VRNKIAIDIGYTKFLVETTDFSQMCGIFVMFEERSLSRTVVQKFVITWVDSLMSSHV